MTDIEMLPCPFCRHEACMVGKPGSWGYYPATAFVRCGKCNARGPTFHNDEGSSLNYRAEAAAAWNRRAEIEALRAEREVIVKEAVKYADKSGRLEARAERLAEALRRAEGLLRSAGVIAESDLERPYSAATEIKNALHDYDQEGKDG